LRRVAGEFLMAAPLVELRDIFCAALDRTSSQEQAAYLDQVCQGQPNLRARVEMLLLAHAQAGVFLQEAASGQVASVATVCQASFPTPHAPLPVPAIAGYEMGTLLGRGGMGVV
jgi:hypothetical protein